MPAGLDIAIFVTGAAFLLIGIIGKVEAFNIKGGTNNIIARIVLGILGAFLMLIAITSWSSQNFFEHQKYYDQMNRELMPNLYKR